MERVHRIMFGDEDKTDEVIGIVLQTGIKGEIIHRFSILIILQIYALFMSRTESTFKISDEILHLEGLSLRGKSNTKSPSIFKRKPYLRGLWHKHYIGSGVSDMVKNLQIALYNYGLPDLDDKNSRADEERHITTEDISRIVHEAVIGNYLRRSHDSKLTGHWIIYAIHNGENFYLSLGHHTDDESEIRRQIDSVCIPEFPFLADILHKI
ncbi:hypothetical protein [Serratia proteamaculans]|uniref:hypothetical protein n=1 Tax=Serratia proteamaculans TaxID=28151 RepID=UPI00217BD77A|nr:hypothetical protein [Serratia proteamaculans]CAI0987752.1 Uncharacterised protein [Serratia proteamaculans]